MGTCARHPLLAGRSRCCGQPVGRARRSHAARIVELLVEILDDGRMRGVSAASVIVSTITYDLASATLTSQQLRWPELPHQRT